ncbi:alpha-L-rhamnosidase-related protein [Paenibacillus arenilitoris]|uniref:Alpha-L-rhamnosidase n=1 Tax=Paenibacillus arenilitoris TaxID=2772299 RepID=A0A927CIZ5_9BACL|nr:family 78 glycoside hydrolase catalytic domain [Paenibacillus arenilitoris]MBD2868963.1 hypothetical protein [Paenibacillus arenilitoris]
MDIVTKLTDASWIGVPASEYAAGTKAGPIRNEAAYFRCRFDLSEAEDTRLTLSISAHSRYRLWVNGEPILSGPCKGDRWRHYYETVDVSDLLCSGENVLAVKVVSYSPYEAQPQGSGGPFSVTTSAAGPCLIVSGLASSASGDVTADIATGKKNAVPWEAMLGRAVEWEPYRGTAFLGPMERVNGALLPHGWNKPASGSERAAEADEALWIVPDVKWRANGRPYGLIPPFPLQERPIPLLYERERRFRSEMPAGRDVTPRGSFGRGLFEPLVVPPNSVRAVVLDAGELTTGYVSLRTRGGAGSQIRLKYAESYSRKSAKGFPEKGNRDDAVHYELLGHEDVYRPAGGDETYEPFWFRTFRFLRLEVMTGSEPVVVHPPEYRETGYPLEVVSTVRTSADWTGPLWDVSVRTLQRCMHETYEDCPYYEQLQYIMDTRLQILFTYRTSGDPRLARKAIEDFGASLLPEGIIQARYPSMEPQVIPVFALHWIFMVEDYVWQTGDMELPVRCRPVIDSILSWYERKRGEQGLVERLGYWEFFDWVKEWDDLQGSPRATLYGPSANHNAAYICGLKAAARLSRLTGRVETALEYERRAAETAGALHMLCWSEEKGLYREGPEWEQYSQHSQVWAVLAELVEGEDAAALMDRMLAEQGLLSCSYAMSYYLFRALEKAGRYDRTEELWRPWRELLKLGLTTWPEDPFMQRSDCHAWGALPLYEFTNGLLGVRPELPGWEAIRIEPQCLSLREAEGRVITPKGLVEVQWEKKEGKYSISGTAPVTVPVTLVMPDGTVRSIPGGGEFTFS